MQIYTAVLWIYQIMVDIWYFIGIMFSI